MLSLWIHAVSNRQGSQSLWLDDVTSRCDSTMLVLLVYIQSFTSDFIFFANHVLYPAVNCHLISSPFPVADGTGSCPTEPVFYLSVCSFADVMR